MWVRRVGTEILLNYIFVKTHNTDVHNAHHELKLRCCALLHSHRSNDSLFASLQILYSPHLCTSTRGTLAYPP